MDHRTTRRLIVWTACGVLALSIGARPRAEGSTPPRLAVHSKTADLVVPEPTSILEVYRAWGRAFDVEVTFDPKIRDSRIVLELRDVTALDALRALKLSTGTFAAPIAEDRVMVADDTPQNRRQYATQVIRTFVLENIEVKDAMTVVRSLLGAKHLAAHESQNTIVMRDETDTISIAAELLRSLDKPRATAAIEVEVLHLAGQRRDQVADRLRRRGGHGFPQRLSGSQLDHLRDAAQVLAAPTLHVFSGDRGHWKLEDSYTAPAAGGIAHVSVGLDLEVEARVKPASDEVEIEGKLSARDAIDADDASPVTASRETRWAARLGAGESLLLSGFLRTSQESPDRHPGSLLTSLFTSSDQEQGEILIVLTPDIVSKPGFAERDLAPLCIGTEANLKLCGTL